MPVLTATQRSVLDYLFSFWSVMQSMPTRAEISANFGWRSTMAAEDHLRAIERKGYITIAAGVSRGIRFTDAGLAALGETSKPSPLPSGPKFIALPVIDPSRIGRANWGGRAG